MADNVSIKDASGATVVNAANDISSVFYQRVKRSVGAAGSATDFLDKSSRSDTFTGTGNGTAVDVSAQGMQNFSLQVKETGTQASWQVDLKVSLDGTNYTTILTHTRAIEGDGVVVSTGANRFPALYFRSVCTAYGGGGTNIIATIVGMP